MPDATVVIPTLNEALNIRYLVRELLEKHPGLRVIVVDDGSQDGTPKVVRTLAREYGKGVRLLERAGRPKGLTASVIDGVKLAETELVVVMDGDLQHPPEKVAKLLDALEKGADLAVAYRVRVENFGPYRRAMSATATGLAGVSLWLRGSPVPRDVMSGFFGVRRGVFLDAVRRNPLGFEPSGYKVLFDLLKALPKSIRMAQVPYEFGTRKRGESKIGAGQVLAFLRDVVR